MSKKAKKVVTPDVTTTPTPADDTILTAKNILLPADEKLTITPNEETAAPVKATKTKKAKTTSKEKPAKITETVKAKVEKTVKKAKKSVASPTPKKQIYVQYAGMEYAADAIVTKVYALWESQGHEISAINSFDLYIKPEEMAAYYVINEADTGKVDLS